MSDALSTIGSAAVSTIGTVAVVGATAKVVGKAVGGMGGTRTRKSGNYNVFHGTKHHRSGSKRKSTSMLGF